ncbi:hypothetical protein H0I76_17340 [Limibaculum sp. M0105]|uniref:Uncharacterized protein n=1 Tax=Thermohalobaculum xanthum TaxID=2753746 RepID=A0A8J7SGJ9_9RHOB|nr:hypothetical protein [Thermohalobaculum xanthum]MBK0400966.1 hypothetical protein [Thermohalobaculum xanthum]
MPRADQPSSPSEELAERRGWKGETLANGVLTTELAEFCQSGISVVLASCDGGGRPVVARGLACRIDADGRVRVMLREEPNLPFLKAIAAGASVAATFTKPHSHRSIQLKGTHAEIFRPAPLDGPAAFMQTSAFRDELVSVGHSEAFSAGYTHFEPHELAAIEFLPESAFVQTPGPSAGSALAP